MDAKKAIGMILTIAGAIALMLGVFGIFDSGEIMGFSPYAWTIVGVIFFLAGISLIRTVPVSTNYNSNPPNPPIQ